MSSKRALIERIAQAGGGDPKKIAEALKDEQLVVWTTADVIGTALDRGMSSTTGSTSSRRVDSNRAQQQCQPVWRALTAGE